MRREGSALDLALASCRAGLVVVCFGEPAAASFGSPPTTRSKLFCRVLDRESG